MARITPRSAWDLGGTLAPVRPVTRLTNTHVEVHHLGAGRAVRATREQALEVIRSTYRLHVHSNGWRDIFYALVVEPRSGEIIAARGFGTASVTPPPDYARAALTVLLLGDFHTGDRLERYPQAIASISELAAEVGGPARLDWHRHRGEGTRFASLCPGDLAIPTLQAIKDDDMPTANELLAALAADTPEAIAARTAIAETVRQIDYDAELSNFRKGPDASSVSREGMRRRGDKVVADQHAATRLHATEAAERVLTALDGLTLEPAAVDLQAIAAAVADELHRRLQE